MRTRVTLDPDVALSVQRFAGRSGQSFKQAANDLLRVGLQQAKHMVNAAPFQIQAHNFGELRSGMSIDRVAELLDNLDGPSR
jgi:hypothetical protein